MRSGPGTPAAHHAGRASEARAKSLPKKAAIAPCLPPLPRTWAQGSTTSSSRAKWGSSKIMLEHSAPHCCSQLFSLRGGRCGAAVRALWAGRPRSGWRGRGRAGCAASRDGWRPQTPFFLPPPWNRTGRGPPALGQVGSGSVALEQNVLFLSNPLRHRLAGPPPAPPTSRVSAASRWR